MGAWGVSMGMRVGAGWGIRSGESLASPSCHRVPSESFISLSIFHSSPPLGTLFQSIGSVRHLGVFRHVSVPVRAPVALHGRVAALIS